ncbi:tetratricopeptide repeat protein [Acidovorax radicis]|uniref:tetratricopeptide repeat protein n=1 Tax=Acidovorax radicis TaxID=758826 RepID=UPI001CF88CB2|nr:tetratricopeptide repeat protein [Acidovorax radicis]UCU98569.1 tetratricopeptide repeat protein [Acidovorax radicis]
MSEVPSSTPQDLLALAWQRFGEGDRANALRLARQSLAAQATPQAAAALGYFLFDANEPEAAAQVLTPALAQWPHHATAHWYMGLLCRQTSQTQPPHLALAAAYLRRACQLDASLHEAAVTLAWTLHDMGQLPEAAEWAQHALRASREPARLLLMGWLHQRQGQLEPAVPLYREAIATLPFDAPEQGRLHLHLAQCLVDLQRPREAQAALEAGLARLAFDPELTPALAWHHWGMGQRSAAIALARRQTEAHPDRTEAWYLLGVLQQASNNLVAADACFAEVQQRDLTHSDGLLRRAQIQAGWGHATDALWLLQQVLNQQPGLPAAQGLMAQVLIDLQRHQEARRLLMPMLREAPRQSELWRLLAVARLQGGHRAAGLRALERSLRLDADHVASLGTLGWILLEDGDLHRAQAVVQRLLRLRPDDVLVMCQAAFVLVAAGEIATAQALAQRAVAQAPADAEAWRALAAVRHRQRHLSEAQAAVEMALQLQPDRLDSLRQLGWILLADQRFAQAQLAFLRARSLRPEDPVCLLELSEAQLRGGAWAAGMETVDELLARQPDHAGAMLLKARLLTEGAHHFPDGHARALALCQRLLAAQERVGEAARVLVRLTGLGEAGAQTALALLAPSLRRALLQEAIAEASTRHGHAPLVRLANLAAQDFPHEPWAGWAALHSASLCEASQPEDLARLARLRYRELKLRAGMDLSPRSPAQPRKGARPRIGYVVSQLHVSLLRRALASHDAQAVEVFVFSNRPLPPLPGHIHCEPLDIDTLPSACAVHRIDVLIDTGGLHPFEGQMDLLRLYARRLAPLQVGWLGCWGTSGGLFDAYLTDFASIPPAHEARYEEALWRIEGGQWCWDPPVHAPPVGPLPALANGFVTFGVPTRGLRLNPASLQAWAQVLLATPGSSIRFIGELAHDWPQRTSVLATMREQGVDASRVAFDPTRSYEGLLAWFEGIDLLLDSFPSNGGLSLLDALWMGVPVVTLSGEWAGARQALSILAAMDLEHWTATDVPTYVQTACALVRDLPLLGQHRADLRSRMRGSPSVDGRRVAAQIERRCEAFVRSLTAEETGDDPKDRVRAQARRALHDWLDKDAILALPAPAANGEPPALSVIVVLYNQAGLTRKTLQALADQRGVSFETLIVDNASSDETAALLQRVRGAHIVSHGHNLGFLRAVNEAAQRARGRHVVLLNSDAILQEGALAAACARLDAEPAIGALGGRIVLTTGGLQEAGNRIFRDGSTVGMGRGEDPFSPAAMAGRAADYVSGVFLAVPMAVWRLLGGFDDRFAPAYFEDTDFCVRVWRAGFRVVYAPEVLLEHLEWGSAQGDEAPRQMRENQRHFLACHGEWLQHQPTPSPQPLDADRWRSPEDQPRRPRVLVIDNEVPHMFKGGGLPRARLMLQALRDWPVTFFPLWVAEDHWRDVYASLPPSTEVMLDHGTTPGLDRLEALLEQRRGLYDVLVVSRPPNLKALQPLRQRRPELFEPMRMVYDAEALFALREIAEAAVKGRPLSRAAAQARLAGEIGLANGTDHVFVVSDRDAALFRAAGHRVTLLSHATTLRRTAPGPAQRSGLLFVGAVHPDTPNEDGLVWFIEQVMPLLRERMALPPVLSVVGVNRSSRVSELAGPDVLLLGPQAQLEPLYDSARVFVAPVRYAGGVPAKVIEAASNGIPVVASSVLVRQLGWDEGIDIQAARDASAFADGIERLLRDDALWLRQQASAWVQCGARYNEERFGQALRHVLQGMQRDGNA